MLPKSLFAVLYGRPASVFAVLGFALAHAENSELSDKPFVNLPPALLAATFDCSVEDIERALASLCAKPIAYLRPVRAAPTRYYVLRSEELKREVRREYLRLAKQRSRQRLAQGGA